MMRFAGAALLWISCTLTGIVISSSLDRRVKLLGQTLVFLNCLIIEIQYSKNTLPSIIEKLSKEKSLDMLSFLRSCTDEFSKGTDFPVAWSACVESFSYYTREQRMKMLSLGSFLGTSDSPGQISTINIYISFFEQYHKDIILTAKKYCRILPFMGAFIGAAIFILII